MWDYLSSGACRDPLEESMGLRPSTSKTSLRSVVARGLTKTMVAAAKQFKKDLEASASAELQSTGFCFSSFLVWTWSEKKIKKIRHLLTVVFFPSQQESTRTT